jgi:hypothetical protein
MSEVDNRKPSVIRISHFSYEKKCCADEEKQLKNEQF